MKLEINVPTSLNEISLKSYQEFLKVQQSSNDEEFIAQKNGTNILWNRIKRHR
jgi:hypothetical protein